MSRREVSVNSLVALLGRVLEFTHKHQIEGMFDGKTVKGTVEQLPMMIGFDTFTGNKRVALDLIHQGTEANDSCGDAANRLCSLFLGSDGGDLATIPLQDTNKTPFVHALSVLDDLHSLGADAFPLLTRIEVMYWDGERGETSANAHHTHSYVVIVNRTALDQLNVTPLEAYVGHHTLFEWYQDPRMEAFKNAPAERYFGMLSQLSSSDMDTRYHAYEQLFVDRPFGGARCNMAIKCQWRSLDMQAASKRVYDLYKSISIELAHTPLLKEIGFVGAVRKELYDLLVEFGHEPLDVRYLVDGYAGRVPSITALS